MSFVAQRASFLRLFRAIWVLLTFLPCSLKAQDEDQDPQADPSLSQDILIVDLPTVRAQANAYQLVRRRAELISDEVNAEYQEQLRILESERDQLISEQFELETEEFRQASAQLEQRAFRLEQRRLANLARLETRRREIIASIDEVLNQILVQVREEFGAQFIFNQQTVIVWPTSANKTARVLELLNQDTAQIPFEIVLIDEGNATAGQGN